MTPAAAGGGVTTGAEGFGGLTAGFGGVTTGAEGAGDAGTGAGGGAMTVSGAGVVIGLRPMMAATGSVRTSVGVSSDIAGIASIDRDPIVGPTGFSEQAADPSPAAITHNIKCLTLIISSPFTPTGPRFKRSH